MTDLADLLRDDDIRDEDIQDCRDWGTLHDWFDELSEAIEKTKCQLTAHGLAMTAEPEWVTRAGGFIAFAKKRRKMILARCLEIGCDLPADDELDGKLARQVHVLQTRIKAARQYERECICEWLAELSKEMPPAAMFAEKIRNRAHHSFRSERQAPNHADEPVIA